MLPRLHFAFRIRLKLFRRAPQNSVAPFGRAGKILWRPSEGRYTMLLFQCLSQTLPEGATQFCSALRKSGENSVAPFGRALHNLFPHFLYRILNDFSWPLFRRALQNSVPPFGRVSAEFEGQNRGAEACKTLISSCTQLCQSWYISAQLWLLKIFLLIPNLGHLNLVRHSL